MLLSRDKSQLLIIDVQEKLLPAMSDPERVVERCIRLVRAARALDIPMTVSEQYPRASDQPSRRFAKRLAMPERSSRRSSSPALKNDALRDRLHELRRKGRPQVVIGGIEAHVCVTQTAIDLEDQGFEAFVVADATSLAGQVEPPPCARPHAQVRR